MKQLLLAVLISLAAFSQTTQPVPLRVYTKDGITSDTVIDNRSRTNRALTYASVACSGSGSWGVSLNYSSGSGGPWTSYGTGSSITETSYPPIASGFQITAPNYIQVDITSGSPTCSFSGTLNFYINSSGSGSSGTAPYSAQVTGQLTLSVPQTTHLQGTAPVASCFDGSSPYVASSCYYTVATNGDIVFTWSPAFTGKVVILGGNGGSGGGGSLTLPVSVFNGGTGSSTASGARSNLGLDLPIAITSGGTGSTSAAAARAALSLNPTGVWVGDGTTPGGVTASSDLQQLQRKANQTSVTYEFSSPVQVRTQDHVWSYANGGQASGDLSATGSKTITLTPCPIGIYGSNPYVSITSQSRLTSIVDAANISTINFTTNHNLKVGDYIKITGVLTDTDLNGTYVVASAPTSTTATVITANVTDGTYLPTGSDSGMEIDIPFNYIRISGGTGTAETQPLQSGGNCTPGAISGTVVVNTSQTHTGAWSIGTATAGIQEASLYAQTLPNGGEVRLPNGNVTVYATTVLLSGLPVTFRGSGPWATAILADTSLATHDIFYCPGPSCINQFFDMTIAGTSSTTSGAAIHLKDNTSGYPKISNVRSVDTYVGFWIDNSDYVDVLNSYYDQYVNTTAYAGLWVSGSSSDSHITGGHYTTPAVNVPTMLDYGILITGADGVTISSVSVRGSIGIGIEPAFGTGSLILGSVFVNNVIVDTCRNNAVRILSTGTPAGNDFFGNVNITNSHISSADVFENADQILIDTTTMGLMYSGINISNSLVANATLNGIKARNVRGLKINNNNVLNNDWSSTGNSGIYIDGGAYINIVGNILQDTRAVPLQDYGVFFVNPISFVTMTGNSSIGNSLAGYLNSATITNSIASNNTGADDLINSAAAAAVMTLPSNMGKTLSLSVGTGTVNTLNGAIGNGYEINILAPNGVTLSTAGNFAFTRSSAVGGTKFNCIWNTGDSKWYCQ